MNLFFKPKQVLTICMLLMASYGFAQQINLHKASMTLEEVFQQIKKQTGKDIVLSSTNLNIQSIIDIDIEQKQDLKSFLNIYFNDKSGFKLQLSEKAIIIYEHASRKNSVLGKVIAKKSKQALADVNIRINSSEITVQKTDQQGNFLIPSYSTVKELNFSYVGYKKAMLNTLDKFFYIIELEEEGESIDDVVVTGIYQRKKESFTGSAATYSGKDLKLMGNQNVLQSLKTLDPSFQIMESNQFGSDPNTLPNIEINGKSSVIGLTEEFGANPNQPLFILDGFESNLSVINDFSMDRIASITILKDASATAIYGSKAANGVIVVETKRPAAGELKLRYNANTSVNFADLTDYNLMNAREKLEFELKSGYYGEFGVGDQTNIELQYYNMLKEVERGVDTYWLAEPLRRSFTHKQNLSAEGGDKNLRYMMTLTHGNVAGVMKGSDRKSTSGNVKLIYRKGNVSFSNSLTIDYIGAYREPVAFSKFSQANPYWRRTDKNGDVVMRWMNRLQAFNPSYDLGNTNVDKTTQNSYTNNFEFLWDMKPGLNLRYRIGLFKNSMHAEVFRSPYNTEFYQSEALKKGRYDEHNGSDLNYDSDLTLTYVKTFQQKHLLNLVGGTRLDQKSSLFTGYNTIGFVDEEFANPAFSFGYPDGGNAAYTESKRRSASFYLSTGYAYDNRYLFDGTLRSDGSSVYGSSKQFTTIWSTGIGWNMHQESWLGMKQWSWLNTLKLRGSIGNPGNQNFNDYISMRIYRFNQENRNPFGSSVILSSYGNENLRWQKTLNKNVGIEFLAFNRRLRIEGDYIHKTTDPLLVYIGVPSSLGTTLIPQNMGKQITRGITVNSNWGIIQQENFSLRANFSLSSLETKFSSLGNALDNYNNDNKSRNLTRYYDGASPADLWAVRSMGIDPATGREIFLNKNGKQTFTHSFEDEQVVGNAEPKVQGVIGVSLQYKGFSGGLNLRYRYGGQSFMQTLYDKVENVSYTDLAYNQDKRALYDRWQAPGDIAAFKAISTNAATPISSRFVQDNNQLIGESFNLGYETMNKTWLRAAGLSSLMLRAYMNDIFYLSTIKNERGLDYPFARSVSFSLSLGF